MKNLHALRLGVATGSVYTSNGGLFFAVLLSVMAQKRKRQAPLREGNLALNRFLQSIEPYRPLGDVE